MSFKPLPQIIKRIEAQPQWDTLRLYRRLVDCWGQVVAPKAAQHSHPVSLARQILWVATSSSVWAQTLALQRSTLLKKLDILVPDAVKELRFSAANWRSAQKTAVHFGTVVKKDDLILEEDDSDPKTVQEVCQNWLEEIQAKGADLPLCPRCNCPTPVEELARWAICAFCVTREWK